MTFIIDSQVCVTMIIKKSFELEKQDNKHKKGYIIKWSEYNRAVKDLKIVFHH